MKKAFLTFSCIMLLLISNLAVAKTKSIIIDTDASSDDAIAILYLLHHHDVSVKAIIVDRNGGSNPNTAANHIAYLLKLANQENIPIYIGLEKQPIYNNQYPSFLYSLVDKSYGHNNVVPKRVITEDALVKLVMSQPQPQYWLSLGSLTNIADLLQKHPEIKTKITNLTIMGGTINEAGNIKVLLPKSNNLYAEWNIFVDPVAFEQVLQAQIPITLVSLDITDKVLVTTAFMSELEKEQKTAASKLVYHLLAQNMYYIQHNYYDFWDPLAAYVVIHPDQIRVEQKRIQTVLTHDAHFGQLVENSLGYPVNVVTYINQPEFEKSLVTNLNNG